MATITSGISGQFESGLLESMHEFRHDVFVRRLGWSLPLIDQTERDQYDHERTLYVTISDPAGRVTASARVLPTTGRYMLPELFPQLLGGREAPRDAGTWELSRFATNVRDPGEGRMLTCSKTSLGLFKTVLAFGREHDIERFLFVTSIAVERLMLRHGFDAHRIAKPALVGDSWCVALMLETAAAEQLAAAALH
jgi:N-acyl-L-homoserine lactone synthetase